jgi:hypothetical protein
LVVALLLEPKVLCLRSNHRGANIVDEYIIDKILLKSFIVLPFPS